MLFTGYALKWGARSQNLGGFYEKVNEGATSKTIQEADIRALLNHDPNLILGRNKASTLRMAEDTSGLHYEVDMPDTSYARDLAVSMERGDITQSSFGFRTIDDDWGLDENDDLVRTLNEIALFDVSPVTYPAYLDSTSGVGSRQALERFAEKRSLGVDLDDIEAVKAALRGDAAPVELPAIAGVDPDLMTRTLALRLR